MSDPHLSRRDLLALSAAMMLAPGAASAQGTSPALMNRLAALSGFDPLPQDLLRGLVRALGNEAAALEREELPADLRDRVLRALYTGVLPGDTDTRIGFSSALMWGAVEDTNNVISYCGGLPGYWAEPPEAA